MIGPKNFNRTIACQDCGQLVQVPKMQDKTIARCFRCNAKLLSGTPDTTDRTLALAFTSLILFVIINIYPFLAMRIEGFVQQTHLITGVVELYHQGMPEIALLVLLTIFVLPLFQILGLIYIYLPMKFGYMPWKTARIFRAIRHLQRWGMMEVYILGILISMIKLAKMATIIPGFASFALMVLICILTTTLSGLNPEDVWTRLQFKNKVFSGNTKKGSILIGCHSCKLLCRTQMMTAHHTCPRCQALLHIRKPNSVSRTWALVIAAAVLYFPANIFPVTLTSAPGHEQADTILSGVIYFLFSGSWHIALVIFVASILIPLTKLIILVYLLISVHKKSTWKPKDRTRLYRITEVVGRWSMVDVFVVTILVSLVQLEPLANIAAGPGVVYFSAVVVITMLAAESFDPRLIWDAMEESDEHN
ncbi:MAG: paraquat-inducible protein A [Desulfobacula sp.]|jgi:paraquat-inducible protein A|uniref:paraquat-inducible protein A n=1 Tax=Desulfobacula sp. TaxID=2593537 RepID=UPI001DC0A0A7|nr:paraquat-inducible protein A [Desulfobacula sp.]MBT3483704.1 paraquat-inducible protein A [Desulfobacula sp.]MBT3803521.1 paraquat-inducible protein A [Desulfobacula sp.]MBT4023316.1 paraquat-inducible protein A [Desulfobacula sp.]MBT4197301.1 paraquat-inducible protein A [Desulfobacula sp.]